jgi:glutaredoxin
MTTATRLSLLSRPGCHLCEEMAGALDDLGVAFEHVNIEEDAALSAAYGELIPVLMQGDAEVARAPQSARTLKRALQRSGVI